MLLPNVRRFRRLLIVAIVLASVIITSGIYYFIFRRDQTPPEIKDLDWQPTRVVNSKVYDGTVSFTAEDKDSIISEVYLEFNPIYPSHLPREAFPEEASRRIDLVPIDGKFDEKIEEFSADIKEIVGGKEYEIKVFVKDATGNVATANLITPYIREFENIAPLDDITISAVYRPFHLREFKPQHSPRTPLLGGVYKDTDIDLIISKHIDWASGHGIDVFICDWNGPGTLEDSLIGRVFRNNLAYDMKFAIDVEVQWRFTGTTLPDKPPEWVYYDFNQSDNRATFLADMKYILNTYVRNYPQNYLTINNKPVVFFWDSKSFIGDFPSVFKEAHESARQHGFGGFFFYGCEIGWVLEEPREELLQRFKSFDAVSIWAAGYSGEPSEDGDYIRSNHESLLETLYSNWSEALRKVNIALVPSVIPGFDGTKAPWGDPNQVPLPRDLERFKRELKIALKYMDDNMRMVRIDTWNDWYENTQIEPSKEELFSYLKVLKELFIA